MSSGVAYRYIDSHSPLVDPYLITYPIVKATDKTYYVQEVGGKLHRIRVSAHKKWACLTQDGALTSYIRRKRAQIRILTHSIRITEQHLVRAIQMTDRNTLKLLGYKPVPERT
jgi:hypothetical protein